MRPRFLLFLALLALPATAADSEWPQLGGPHRNFTADTKGLANSWPAGGPRKLWGRDLGEGYSGIVADGSRLYTLYREEARFWQMGKPDQEVVVALDANTGKTIWEYRYDAAFAPRMQMENGPGPHATPLVVGNQLFTVGVMAVLHCFDKNTGKVLWSHDLYKEFKAPLRGRGYSSSPLAYKDTIILPVGGPGQALVAFRQKDGAVAWKNQDLDWSQSSPLIIDVDGQDQLVWFGGNAISGLDPNDGELLWSHPHTTDYGLNISMPVWGPGNLLFCTSAYSGGSRVLQLIRTGNKTAVKQLWFNNRMRVHFGTAVRVGDYVYGSSGDFGPAFFSAVDVKTGQILWQDRSFAKASMVYADGKFIIVDEDGSVALATVSPSGLKVISKVALLSHNAWTPPTLAGKRLYVRDRKAIMALELP